MDEQIIYYYRNGFSAKGISEKTGLTVSQVKNRLQVIRRKRELKRWWEEDT